MYIDSVYYIMTSADTVEKVVLKFIEDQNLELQKLLHYFIFRSKSCLAAGLRSDPLRELKRSPDFIFGPHVYQKRLAAGLRLDPLGELQRSPRPLATVGVGWPLLGQARKSSHLTLLSPPLVSPTNCTLVLIRLHKKCIRVDMGM